MSSVLTSSTERSGSGASPMIGFTESVQFDSTGWELREESEQKSVWTNAWGDVLSRRLIAGPPRIPSLFRLQSLHDYFREQAVTAGGALLSLELIQVKGVSLARCITKIAQSEGSLLGYVGMLVNVARDHTLMLRMQLLEQPGDEARSLGAWTDLQQHCTTDDELNEHWFPDASQAGQALARTWADDERWDAHYPAHPLSRLRFEFARLIPTLNFSRDIKNAAPHRG